MYSYSISSGNPLDFHRRQVRGKAHRKSDKFRVQSLFPSFQNLSHSFSWFFMIDHTCRIVWCVHDHCLGLFIDRFFKCHQIRLECFKIRRHLHDYRIKIGCVTLVLSKYGANTITSSPGSKIVLKIMFRPPAAPTVITILWDVNAVPKRLFKFSATA